MHTVHTYGTHAQFALDDPQVIWCTWLWYMASPCTYVVNHKFLNYFSIPSTLHFRSIRYHLTKEVSTHPEGYLTKLSLNSITDTPVGTCPLAICNQSVLPVPKLFYFIFIFFQNTVVSIQLGKIPVLGLVPRSTTVQLTHGHERQFGILNCIATVAKSNQIHVFLSYRRITRITGKIYHKYSNFYHHLEKPNICNIRTLPTYTISFLVETRRITRIFGIGHQLCRLSHIIQSIHYSYRHLLNRQCSERYWTIIPMLFDSLAQLQAQRIANTHF